MTTEPLSDDELAEPAERATPGPLVCPGSGRRARDESRGRQHAAGHGASVGPAPTGLLAEITRVRELPNHNS